MSSLHLPPSIQGLFPRTGWRKIGLSPKLIVDIIRDGFDVDPRAELYRSMLRDVPPRTFDTKDLKSSPQILVFEDGSTMLEWRTPLGHLHREDGPAVVFPSKDLIFREYWRWGERHREDGPAITTNSRMGGNAWFLFGQSLPEEALTYRSKVASSAMVRLLRAFGGLENGWVEWSLGGVDVRERYVDGQIAFFEVTGEGGNRLVKHYLRGKLHGEDAIQVIDQNGRVFVSSYRHGILEGRTECHISGIVSYFHGGDRVAEHQVPVCKTREEWGRYVEEWTLQGELHRLNGPAVVECDEHFWLEQWHAHGEFHREDGPAHIQIFSPQGVITSRTEIWCQRGKMHRVDGPAEIEMKDGKVVVERWYKKGVPHRIGDPAIILDRLGPTNCDVRSWRVEGVPYREEEGLPTEEIFHPSGIPSLHAWMTEGTFAATDGKYHRDDGPAIRVWDKEGALVWEEWYIHNVFQRGEGDPSYRPFFLKTPLPSTDPPPPQEEDRPGPLELVSGKAFVDVVEGALRRALDLPEEVWARPSVRAVMRASIPIILSQAGGESWRRRMQTSLTAVLAEEGFSFVSAVIGQEIEKALSSIESVTPESVPS